MPEQKIIAYPSEISKIVFQSEYPEIRKDITKMFLFWKMSYKFGVNMADLDFSDLF